VSQVLHPGLKASKRSSPALDILTAVVLISKFIDLQQFYKTQEEKRAKRKAQIEQAMVEAKAMEMEVKGL